jgi:hypothetical protein
MGALRECTSLEIMVDDSGLWSFTARSAQIIPEISKDGSFEVVNFCRTAQWYVPRVSITSGL